MDIPAALDLRDRLAAAHDDSAHIHNDLCQVLAPQLPAVCTCGMSLLFADALAFVDDVLSRQTFTGNNPRASNDISLGRHAE